MTIIVQHPRIVSILMSIILIFTYFYTTGVVFRLNWWLCTASPSLKPTAVPATSPASSAHVSALTGTTAKAETTALSNNEYVIHSSLNSVRNC